MPLTRAARRQLLALSLSAAMAAALSPPAQDSPPAPDTQSPANTKPYSENNAARTILGLPLLLFAGVFCIALLVACSISSGIRRRMALRNERLVRARAQAARATSRAVELATRLTTVPVTGVPLWVPWPPVKGTPAYEVLGRPLEPGEALAAQGTARVVRADLFTDLPPPV